MSTILYRMKEAETQPQNMEYAGEEYRKFICIRNNAFLFWKIETLEQTAPPLELQGLYTSLSEAKLAIDLFQDRQKKLEDLKKDE